MASVGAYLTYYQNLWQEYGYKFLALSYLSKTTDIKVLFMYIISPYKSLSQSKIKFLWSFNVKEVWYNKNLSMKFL